MYLCRDSQVNMQTLKEVLIPNDWCPSKRRKRGHRNLHRGKLIGRVINMTMRPRKKIRDPNSPGCRLWSPKWNWEVEMSVLASGL